MLSHHSPAKMINVTIGGEFAIPHMSHISQSHPSYQETKSQKDGPQSQTDQLDVPPPLSINRRNWKGLQKQLLLTEKRVLPTPSPHN
jgi:hypothetical protein